MSIYNDMMNTDQCELLLVMSGIWGEGWGTGEGYIYPDASWVMVTWGTPLTPKQNDIQRPVKT